MQCKKIYEGALRILAESTAEDENEDYAERAPYLIASLCGDLQDIDRKLRQLRREMPPKKFSPLWISLDDPFPLCDRLVSAACLYLAAMLILDERPELSDKIYERYCDRIAAISASIPATAEPIINRYH